MGNLKGNGYFLKNIKSKEIMTKEMCMSASENEMKQWIVKKYKTIPNIKYLFN